MGLSRFRARLDRISSFNSAFATGTPWLLIGTKFKSELLDRRDENPVARSVRKIKGAFFAGLTGSVTVKV